MLKPAFTIQFQKDLKNIKKEGKKLKN